MQPGISESDHDEVVNVQPHICRSTDILVPVPTLAPLSQESTEDWDERIADLFEWVGMACIGAQRFVPTRYLFQTVSNKTLSTDSKQMTVSTHTLLSTKLPFLRISAT